jgi:alcohol dehydrogenase class IV
MLSSFAFSLPTQVIFGRPALEALAAQLDALHATRVLLVSDPGIAALGWPERYCAALAGGGGHPHEGSRGGPPRRVTVFTDVSSNPTTEEVAAGLALAKEQDVEAVVALGGGSAIDVAKAIAMLLGNGGTYADYQWGNKAITQRSWPVIAIPTTAGTGSEVSKVMVLVDPDRPFKKGVLSPLMFPHAAIIDPDLARSLPPKMTAATGMDAFIHALEAYTGQRANPFTDQFALAALETGWHALPVAVANGENMDARQQMALAAVWGGIAMDQGGLGLIHALSGPLTSHLHLHHGLANALILPYVMRFNLPALAPGRRRRLCAVIGLPAEAADETIVATLTQFVQSLGLPVRLSELDRPTAGADWAAIAEETPRMVLIGNNPRPATAADCAAILAEMQ